MKSIPRKVVWRGCERKERFDNEHEALRKKTRREKAGSGPLRVYACNTCHGWHLTGRAR